MYGSVSTACPTFTGASFVDCNSGNGTSSLDLNYLGAAPNETYLVLIDTDGGTGDFILNVTGSNQTPLPVYLLNFTGENVDKVNILHWETSSEFNSHHFGIERSADGEHFQEIGITNAAGFSNVLRKYPFTDYYPMNGTNYYRLQLVDMDGNATPSNVIEIINTEHQVVSVYPTPFQDELVITTEGITGDIQFSLYNSIGQLVLSQSWKNTQSDKNLHNVEVENLAPGAYYYRFISDNTSQIGKVVKE